MSDGGVLSYIFPALAVTLQTGLVLGPMPMVLNMRKTKIADNVNTLLFPFMLHNAVIWLMYGLVARDWFIFSINVLASNCSIFYTLSALSSDPREKHKLRIEMVTMFHIVQYAFLALMASYVSSDTSLQVLGIMGNVSAILMYMSPLATMRQIIVTKDSSSINVPFLIFQMCTSFCWLVYGFILQEAVMYPPNVLGLLLGVIQIVLKLRYPSRGLTHMVHVRTLSESSSKSEPLAPAMPDIESVPLEMEMPIPVSSQLSLKLNEEEQNVFV